MTRVRFEDTAQGLDAAVSQLFDAFGGVTGLLKRSKDVYIKVNGIDYKPHAIPLRRRAAAVRYFKAQWSPEHLRDGKQHPGELYQACLQDHGHETDVPETAPYPYISMRLPRCPCIFKVGILLHIPDFIHENLIQREGTISIFPCPSSRAIP